MPLKKKKKKKAAPRKTVKRKPVKKPARKKIVKKTRPKKITKRPAKGKKRKENLIGIITHYFPKVSAAVIKLKAPLTVGDTIKIKGHTTDFIEPVNSIQIDRVPITAAKKGQEIGLLVNSRVRQHDKVYKV